MTRGKLPISGSYAFFSLFVYFFFAEGGSAYDAEAPQGAEDVHDPDHRPVQVRLPSPHPISPKLQTHLTLNSAPPQWGADGRSRQATGSRKMGAKIIHKHHALFYMR